MALGNPPTSATATGDELRAVAVALGGETGAPVRVEDMRHHVTLSGPPYLPANDNFIAVGEPIRVRGKTSFIKYRVLVRDAAANAFIGLGRRPEMAPGLYDDICPGGNEIEERCEATSDLWVVFDAVPATGVEVVLFAGVPALPA